MKRKDFERCYADDIVLKEKYAQLWLHYTYMPLRRRRPRFDYFLFAISKKS